MPLVEINRSPTPRELRQFACLAIPGFCVLLGVILIHRFALWLPAIGILALGALVGLDGWFHPVRYRRAFVGWMTLTAPAAWLVSCLAMSLAFWLAIVPAGLILRLFRSDPLARTLKRSEQTYWRSRPKSDDKSRYFRQY